MARYVIFLPVDDYERAMDLQHRLLTYEIDAEAAEYEMHDILAPHVKHMPGRGDETVLLPQRTIQVEVPS